MWKLFGKDAEKKTKEQPDIYEQLEKMTADLLKKNEELLRKEER